MLVIGGILICAHVSGCGFYFVGRYDYQFNQIDSWIINWDIINETLFHKYMTSTYFTYITMVTVGYGDIHPVTSNERMYTILLTLFSCGFFASAVNKLGSLLSEQFQRKKLIRDQQQKLQIYLNERKISQQLQFKILRNHEYIHQKEQQIHNDVQQILDKIDQRLLTQFKHEYFQRVMSYQKLLQFNFSEQTLNELSQVMYEKIYYNGIKVFSENSQVDSINMIIEGEIELISECYQRKNLGTIQQQKFYGVNGFFGNKYYQYTGISKGKTKCIHIDKKDFKNIVRKRQKDYEQYCMLQDKVQNDQFYLIQGESCKYCSLQNHDQTHCPDMHVKYNKWIQIQRHLYSQNQERNKSKENYRYYRKNQDKYQTLRNIQDTKDSVKRTRIEILYIISSYEIQDQDEENQILMDNTLKGDLIFYKTYPTIQYNKVNEAKYNQMKRLILEIQDINSQSLLKQFTNDQKLLNQKLSELKQIQSSGVHDDVEFYCSEEQNQDIQKDNSYSDIQDQSYESNQDSQETDISFQIEQCIIQYEKDQNKYNLECLTEESSMSDSASNQSNLNSTFNKINRYSNNQINKDKQYIFPTLQKIQNMEDYSKKMNYLEKSLTNSLNLQSGCGSPLRNRNKITHNTNKSSIRTNKSTTNSRFSNDQKQIMKKSNNLLINRQKSQDDFSMYAGNLKLQRQMSRAYCNDLSNQENLLAEQNQNFYDDTPQSKKRTSDNNKIIGLYKVNLYRNSDGDRQFQQNLQFYQDLYNVEQFQKIMDFDSMKEYEIYKKYNNYTLILKNYEEKKKNQLSKKKSSKVKNSNNTSYCNSPKKPIELNSKISKTKSNFFPVNI